MKTSVESYISIAVLIAMAFTAAASAASEPGASAGARSDDADDESDSASFTVVVLHADGWRCGAALVSLRTALTSARCALGRGGTGAGARELWASAPRPGSAAPAASRVLRVAYAAGADLDAGAVRAWGALATARDVALLELATALGGARPILLATSRADCEPPPGAAPACYLVRVLGSGASTRLRIVELTLRGARACWAPSSAHRALCLAGPPLCQSEVGAGVVCGGKLCGVLSASRGAGAGECGAPHAAASAPRWRRFLHCALARGACGRIGDCARLCTERWLVEEENALPALPAPASPNSLSASVAASSLDGGDEQLPTRTTLADVTEAVSVRPETLLSAAPPPTRSPPAPPAPPESSERVSTARHALEFEPNRADFTAGEYGDNAAEYAAPVDEPAPLAEPPVPPAPPAEPLAALPGPQPAPTPKVSAPTPAHRSRAQRRPTLPPHLLTALLFVCCFV